MRRFGWQIGGILTAVLTVAALGLAAFGCGSSRHTGAAKPLPTAHATATADPRVAEVEDAARRYVTALADSMRTGSATELDNLSVPGSQAEGNAGIAAGIVQDKHVAFVSTQVKVTTDATTVNTNTAEVSLEYALDGYDADWPSLKQRGSQRVLNGRWVLDFSFLQGAWLVDTAH